MAAAAANFISGQRDLQMSSLRRLSGNASTSSAIDVSNARLFNSRFRLKGCSSENHRSNLRSDNHSKNELQRARACGPSPSQLLCDSRDFNVEGAADRGSCNGVPHRPLTEKITVAVDVDEVLGKFVSAVNRFIADRYSLNHSISEYHVYEFFKVWNCSRGEADTRVHEFFKTHYFKKGIHPIPGARKSLHKLSQFCNLSIVTSRQNAIKDHTIEWVEEHYPGLFLEIHFGNHFALDGQPSRPKSEICKSLGAKVLIDDNPRYAIECAENGIKVLLFDYENSYPWCKTEYISQHPLITKVHSWQEVEHQLTSLIV
ncbi:hypothetical protein ABFX02_12G135900 [Erythranthe guttata]